MCVAARSPTRAAGSCRVVLNASAVDGVPASVVCKQREAAQPSALDLALGSVDLAQKALSSGTQLVAVALLWCACVSWRHFRSSMRYICLAVIALLGSPYVVSLVPWYSAFGLEGVLSESDLYSLSPTLAEASVRATVVMPVILPLQSGLLALFPALSYAAVVGKTFKPSGQFFDVLLAGVPVFLLTFNWPVVAMGYQLTGSFLFLTGGLLFSGSRLIFTFYFRRFVSWDDTAEGVRLLQTLSTRYLVGVFLGMLLILAGLFEQFGGMSYQVLRGLLVSPYDLVAYTAQYYTQFYLTYVAAADICVFGGLHFGSKRFAESPEEEELATSFSVLTSEEAVFRGGRRRCCFPCCRFPV